MNTIRKLQQVYTPDEHPGFLGPGHVARPVIQDNFSVSDPFIMLMDDVLDKQDEEPAGGPHPHAGFETVTLVLEGKLGDGPGSLKQGDFEMMTAGRGVVHTETITEKAKVRILQLWLGLPEKHRWTLPRVQKLRSERVPKVNFSGVDTRVYSGSFAGVTSPVQNYTPLILADIRMGANKILREVLPAHFTTFFYVIEGSVKVGDDAAVVTRNQVGWLSATEATELELHADKEGAHIVLYSAEPQKQNIVAHGPFVADTMEEIKQLYTDFRYGKMIHIHDVSESQQLVL